MSRTGIAGLVGVVVLCTLGTSPGAAAGQAALEKSEKSIRRQVGLAGAAGKPATRSQRDESQDAQTRGQASGLAKAESAAADEALPRGYLGAVVDDRADRGRGIRVERVIPGGPAQQAGLRAGDLITGLGGIRVRQMADFAAILEQVAPGNALTFEILRGEKREKLDVVFGPPVSGKRTAPTAPPSSPPPPEPTVETAPPTVRAPVSAGATGKSKDDRARIELLERRIEQLERRIEQLEQVLKTRQGKS